MPFRRIASLPGFLSLILAGSLRADAASLAQLTVSPDRFVLTGRFDGRQLIVTAQAPGQPPRDETGRVQYTAFPGGIVQVNAQGYVHPLAKGSAAITIDAAGRQCAVQVTVQDLHDNRPVHFANEVVPVLTRYGCNAGGCHGKASGQNGFKLSLFGFDADFDYSAIVREARGRRVFPEAPDHSPLLTKPTARVPHGGGRRFGPDSEAYRLLARWIGQGMPVGAADAPVLRGLEFVPSARVLDRQAQQQVALLAHYSDGSVRDVTRQAQFQSNAGGVAVVEDNGLVRTLDQAGEAAIMGRYLGLVAVFQATVPLGKPIAHYPHFPAANFIDRLALAKWRKLGLVPSASCTDGEFIRRLSLDLCGKLPAAEDVRAFLADRSPDKRARLIDRCLEDPDHAAFFALRWGGLLRNSARQDGSGPAAYAFHEWLRDMIARNRPYDQLVRGIVTATGNWEDAPAINWFWQMREDPLHQPVSDTAQLFLGLRLQCARCHHHPYERWSQDDYFGLAGFFARLGVKDFDTGPTYFPERAQTTGEVHPRTGQALEPKFLDGPVLPVKPTDDPRRQLADWMARPDNPFFAKALCNRMWGYLLGRGLVDPVDDLRETNPPSNPELLDALAHDFVAHHFDVRHLLRTICNSRTYQLSAVPNDYNRHDRQNHARYFGKRLMAEVLYDAVDRVCGTETAFSNVPAKTRAVELPHEGFDSYFLTVFDRPERNSACECARSTGASLPQVLHLAYAPEIEDKIAADDGRIAKLVQGKTPAAKIIEELYLAALARFPTDAELKYLSNLEKVPDQRRALEDLVWTLLNSREFLFNH
jgi:hypothetical protein